MHHRPRRGDEIRLADVMPFFFSLHNTANEVSKLVVRRTTSHQLVQIVVPYRKEAGANFAVRSNADAAAMPAERMRDGRNDSEFADAVIKAIAARGFALSMPNLYKRAIFGHAMENLIKSDHCFRSPDTVFFEWHEFDEAHDYAFFAREHAEGDDLIFIEAAHKNAVDLDGP